MCTCHNASNDLLILQSLMSVIVRDLVPRWSHLSADNYNHQHVRVTQPTARSRDVSPSDRGCTCAARHGALLVLFDISAVSGHPLRRHHIAMEFIAVSGPAPSRCPALIHLCQLTDQKHGRGASGAAYGRRCQPGYVGGKTSRKRQFHDGCT